MKKMKKFIFTKEKKQIAKLEFSNHLESLLKKDIKEINKDYKLRFLSYFESNAERERFIVDFLHKGDIKKIYVLENLFSKHDILKAYRRTLDIYLSECPPF